MDANTKIFRFATSTEVCQENIYDDIFLPFLLTIEGEVADAAAIVIVDHVTICDNMGDAANGSGYI